VHRSRFIAVVMLGFLLCTVALPWQPGIRAQPMCPIDTIWSAEEEACVDLEPTTEPTATTEPMATTEPIATTEPTATSEPGDERPTTVVDDQEAPTTEASMAPTAPSRKNVQVAVLVSNCPQRVVDELILDYVDLNATCGVPDPEIEVQVLAADGARTEFTTNGIIYFEGVAPGRIRIKEFVPDGYGVPLVYCMVPGPQGQTVKQPDLEIVGEDLYVTLENVNYDDAIICDFFNVPGEAAQILNDPDGVASPAVVASPTVDTSDQFFLEDWWEDWFGFDPAPGLAVFEGVCDHVIDPTDSLEEIWPRCRSDFDTEDVPHFTYDVVVNGRLEWTSYNGGGFWSTNLPAGEYRIIARYNDQYKPPFAACYAWRNDQDQPVVQIGPQQLPISGEIIMPNVPAVANITCRFNYIPILETAVTADLIAYTCPQHVVDEFILNYRDLVLLCGLPGEEVEMQLVHSNGVANQFTHLGLASFDAVPAGSISVREVIPEGYGVPLVYCMVTGPEGQTIKQQDLEIIGNNYYVTVDNIPPGSNVICEFFNVPGETPEFDGPPVTWWREDTSIG